MLSDSIRALSMSCIRCSLGQRQHAAEISVCKRGLRFGGPIPHYFPLEKSSLTEFVVDE